LPISPGMAVPGQWLGPWSMLRRVMPSMIGCTRPILGISIVPISFTGSAAYGSGGTSVGRDRWATADAATGAAVVGVVVGGTVVVTSAADVATAAARAGA